MGIDFKTATDILFAKVSPSELADVLNKRVAVINNARVAADRPTHSEPPPGWAQGIVEVAKRRLRELSELIHLCECNAAAEAHEKLVETLIEAKPGRTRAEAEELARKIDTEEAAE